MSSSRTGRCLLVASIAFCGAACSSDPAAPEPEVASVAISPSTASLSAVGATAQLTATARSPSGATLPGRAFEWSSSNNAVATVNNTGLVTAATTGHVSITATTNGVSGSASVQVSLPAALYAVSAGFDHSCALVADGAAYCWGRNNLGQLGDGSTSTRFQPVAVQGGLRFRSISAGHGHTCAVATTGEGYCWGNSDRGQVGDGGLQQRTAPVRVVGVASFEALEAGRAHTCGIAPTGIVYCWGAGTNGEMGTGTLVASRVAPDSVYGGRRYTTVAGSAHTVCATATNGESFCWGRNNTGQIGDGTATCTGLSAACFGERAVPTRVLSAASFTRISTHARIVNGFGGGTSCGVTASAEGYCWGQNSSGEIGDGTTTQRLSPVAVSGSRAWRTIAVGSATSCGVTTANVGYCWGFNGNGSVGDGTSTNRLIPTPIAGGFALSSVSVGFDHACATTVGGEFFCWGSNQNGELGDGTTTSRAVPTRADVPTTSAGSAAAPRNEE